NCQATAHFRLLESAACLACHIAELPSALIQEKVRRLRVPDVAPNIPHRFVDVPVRHDQVYHAVEIGVDERTPEPERVPRWPADPRRHRHVVIHAAPTPAIEPHHFVVEIRNRYSGFSTVLKIADRQPHSGPCFALATESQSSFDGHFLEASITQIPVELVGLRIVGY